MGDCGRFSAAWTVLARLGTGAPAPFCAASIFRGLGVGPGVIVLRFVVVTGGGTCLEPYEILYVRIGIETGEWKQHHSRFRECRMCAGGGKVILTFIISKPVLLLPRTCFTLVGVSALLARGLDGRPAKTFLGGGGAGAGARAGA